MENNSIETHELQNGLSHTELGEVYVSACLSDDPNSLEHYGILGMKWGVRRYQNKDGSLTKAGSKRYSDAVSNAASKVGKAVVSGGKKVGSAVGKAGHAIKDKVSEKHAQRKEEKRVEDLMSKPIRKLTESEYTERMQRKMKEKELRNLEQNVNDISSKTKSIGRKFCEDLVTKVAIPSVMTAGEKQLTAFLNKKFEGALGLGDKDTNLMQQIINGEKQLKDLTDGQINKLGKNAESWGNVTKFIFGKNTDQNNEDNDGGTVFRDLMNGKLKTSDATDGQLSKGKKGAEAADAIEKQKQKIMHPESATSQTTDGGNSSKRSKSISEMTDKEAKAYKERLELNKKLTDMENEQTKREIENGMIFTKDQIDGDYY